VPGGEIGLISAYAPDSGYNFDIRQQFFRELGEMYSKTSVNGPKLILGDLNSRLQRRLPGEDDYMGEYTFGNRGATLETGSNRELLVELCAEHCLVIGNTFFEHPPEEQVTFRSLGTPPLDPISAQKFAQLDYVLTSSGHLQDLVDVRSSREEPLASHHFLVVADLIDSVCVQSHAPRTSKCNINCKLLAGKAVANTFSSRFEGALASQQLSQDVNVVSDSIAKAFEGAAQDTLREEVTARRQKPWISHGTLDLIDKRRVVRMCNNFEEEKKANKEIRTSARSDRRKWLIELAGEGTWAAMKKLRKPAPRREGKLKSKDGIEVSSEERANTLASYLQDVQWEVRPAKLVDDRVAVQLLPVELGRISLQELRDAAYAMKSGKAPGMDGHPVEFWKTILSNSGENPSEGAVWLLHLCNLAWEGSSVPEAWHLQRVAMLYKKGDPAECGNYRPVCLLNAAYKIFAMILFGRLIAAGADDRVWPSQFGFRRKRGTEDALHCARRAVERTWAERGGHMHMLAVDWRMAFDSVNTGALLQALLRFGIPPKFVDVIKSIYKDRVFQVRDCGITSEVHHQRSGICQGGPLSPFLFIIVMTALMKDASNILDPTIRRRLHSDRLFDILYADDTLLLGTAAGDVEAYAKAVETAGAWYGMSLHWGKTQAMSICTTTCIKDPRGKPMEDKGSMVYLGGLLVANGRADSEISRKIGTALGDFRQLAKVWSHSNISRGRKQELFHSLVVSKLLYGLSSLWLVRTQRRRLDGVYARCLRRIWGIPSAYISRVSNAHVLEKADVEALSTQLLQKQLVLFGKVARAPANDPMRLNTFLPGSLQPQIGSCTRRVGRPREDWTTKLSIFV
jgi:hypothetical protein